MLEKFTQSNFQRLTTAILSQLQCQNWIVLSSEKKKHFGISKDYYSASLRISPVYTEESHGRKWTRKFSSACLESIRWCLSNVLRFLHPANHWQENTVLKAQSDMSSETHLLSRVLVSWLAVFALAASPVARSKCDQQHKTRVFVYIVVTVLTWGVIWVLESKNS